jgi:S-adenosyl-L-methionine hydrolase (adenosine-forming)
MAIITLLTDFGLTDEYVGVIKGVICGINPAVGIIDVTHGIALQNVVAAAYTLKAAYSYFPQGSIHIAVVDPGVGTKRDIVAVRCAGYLFLAPDNGLLAPILKEHAPDEGYRVENENLFRHPVSPTFHGRDVFAPVAAHLSRGLSLKALGRPLDFDALQPLRSQGPRIDPSGVLEGEVVGVDRFGNLITNISSRQLSTLGTGKLDILLGDRIITTMTRTYAQGKTGEILALIGSRNCLEIAVNGASASKTLNLTHGEIVRIKRSMSDDR